MEWSGPGATRDPEDIQFVRMSSDVGNILGVLASSAALRGSGRAALSEAYAAITILQLETVHHRATAGSGTLRLDSIEGAVGAAIANGEIPPGAREMFQEARHTLGAAPTGHRDADIDRLIGRIQALRSKTMAQGCTEQEALSAASKAAELLDCYGLSLSELDLRRQTYEGAPVETGRKRAGPLDECVPAIGSFFDCRAWGEKTGAGMLRYVFFGLRRMSWRHGICTISSNRHSRPGRKRSGQERRMPQRRRGRAGARPTRFRSVFPAASSPSSRRCARRARRPFKARRAATSWSASPMWSTPSWRRWGSRCAREPGRTPGRAARHVREGARGRARL